MSEEHKGGRQETQVLCVTAGLLNQNNVLDTKLQCLFKTESLTDRLAVWLADKWINRQKGMKFKFKLGSRGVQIDLLARC